MEDKIYDWPHPLNYSTFGVKDDPLTKLPPRFAREITCFDRPTTYKSTIKANRLENERIRRRRR